MDSVLPVLRVTNHASAQVLMEFKSTLRWLAAPFGESTMMCKLVSSANSHIEQPNFLLYRLCK